MTTERERTRILVTGATGYVGGRLVPRLLEAGYAVRCFVRDEGKLAARPWIGHPRLSVVEGDGSDAAALARALEGCSAAYYLIHSMIVAGSRYQERDLEIARNFAAAAERSGVKRIVYLGGLGETGSGLSPHLRSRREVETALRSGAVPVTVLRAAMIVGAGSASFEILRYLVERLPVMVTPKWVRTRCQPISIHDTLRYLVRCLEVPETAGRTLDIGGPEVLTYRDIMSRTAAALGVRRNVIVPVPVLTPRLSSLWIHLVTPVGSRIARPLAEGLKNPVVCRDDAAVRLMPFERLGVDASIRAALGHGPESGMESSWLDAGPVPGDPDWAGGTSFTDRREVTVHASRHAVFQAVCTLGGKNGWWGAGLLWKLRGWMDKAAGGPGLSRGRRWPDRLSYGDVVDFWRVADIRADRRLELRAEMKLPGQAVLVFEIVPHGPNAVLLVQTARFKPRGLLGLVYWFAVTPFHGLVFGRMVRGIRGRAEGGAAPSLAGSRAR